MGQSFHAERLPFFFIFFSGESMKTVIPVKLAESLLGGAWIQKSRKGEERSGHKYIFRRPKSNGEGFDYIYAEDQVKRPFEMLRTFFQMTKEVVTNLYRKNDIEKDYRATEEQFAQHLLEYNAHKDKWDKAFSDMNKNRATKKPRTMDEDRKIRENSEKKEKKTAQKKETDPEKFVPNRSLMRKIWAMMNPDKANRADIAIANIEAEKKEEKNKDAGKPESKETDVTTGDDGGAEEKKSAVEKLKFSEEMIARNGNKYRVAKPTEEFWEEWRNNKDTLKAAGYSVFKNENGFLVYDWSNKRKATRSEELLQEQRIKEFNKQRLQDMIEDYLAYAEDQGIKISGTIKTWSDLDASIEKEANNSDGMWEYLNSNHPTFMESVMAEAEKNGEKTPEEKKPEPEVKTGKLHLPEKAVIDTKSDMNSKTGRFGYKGMEVFNIRSDGNTFEYDYYMDRDHTLKVTDRYIDVESVKDYGDTIYVYAHDENNFEKVQIKIHKPEGWTAESEAEKHENRSQAMMGNDNARKDGAEAESVPEKKEPQTEKQKDAEEKKTEKARKDAGLPEIGKNIGERVSAIDDTISLNPNSENYAYKDTGYIARSQKEKIADFWARKAASGDGVGAEEIDWNALEENPRYAEKMITKSNVLGKTDYDAWKESGMDSRAAFLASRVLAAVGKEPVDKTEQGRKAYVTGIDTLKSRLAECKTIDDVLELTQDIHDENNQTFYNQVERDPRVKQLKEELEKLNEKREILDEKLSQFYDEKILPKLKRKIRVSAEEKRTMLSEEADRLEPGVKHEISNDYFQFFGGNGIGSPFMTKERKECREKIIETKKKVREELKSRSSGGVWNQLGDKLYNISRSKAFLAHYNSLDVYDQRTFTFPDGAVLDNSAYLYRDKKYDRYESWEWTEQEPDRKKKGESSEIIGGLKKRRFELLVPKTIERKGGRNVSAKTTQELKEMFNFRDIQVGTYVQTDPASAKWHIDNIAAGFADLCDITGIPDSLISLNGRLSIAVGARGHKGALAHYESLYRVINMTKMKGGGSLGHEWFHAFDNLIAEAMNGGNYDIFLTENKAPGSDEKNARIKSAFEGLVRAMKEGTTPERETVEFTEDDYDNGKRLFTLSATSTKAGYGDLAKCRTLDEAVDYFYSVTQKRIDWANRMLATKMGNRYAMKDARQIIRKKNAYIRAIAAYFSGSDSNRSGTASVKTGKTVSKFYADALNLENGKTQYWSTTKEMAARAFSAYLGDRLEEQGRKNDYLAGNTSNEGYSDKRTPYPYGDERKKINAAFDELFRAVKETKAISKAIFAVDAGRGKMNLFMKKSVYREVCKSLGMNDPKFGYFKEKVLEHLEKLEKKERKELRKSLTAFEATSLEKSGYPVGTIREWKGRKFIKVAPGKWRPKYDGASRGAKMAIAALKKKVDECRDSEELMKLVLENRSRFSDDNGRPLPFVKELSDYVSGRNDIIEQRAKKDETIKNRLKKLKASVLPDDSNLLKAAEAYANDKQIATYQKKIDINNFTLPDDPTRPGMCGIYHDNGNLVATDSNYLLMEKEDYPEELEGKLMVGEKQKKFLDKLYKYNKENYPNSEYTPYYNEKGEIDQPFPNYKRIIPDTSGSGYADLTEQFNSDLTKIEKCAFLSKKMKDKKADETGAVKIGSCIFTGERISNILAIAKKHGGLKGVYFPKNPGRPAVFEGEGFKAIIMPGRNPETYIDSSSGDFVGKQDSITKDFLAGDKESPEEKYRRSLDKIFTSNPKMEKVTVDEVIDTIDPEKYKEYYEYGDKVWRRDKDYYDMDSEIDQRLLRKNIAQIFFKIHNKNIDDEDLRVKSIDLVVSPLANYMWQRETGLIPYDTNSEDQELDARKSVKKWYGIADEKPKTRKKTKNQEAEKNKNESVRETVRKALNDFFCRTGISA